jgi:prolyl-tRNA synthetase
MRWSEAFIPTLKEDPADAEIVSHKLLVRAGLMRRLANGIFSFLPLGWRVVRNVERIVREEMNRSGALELLMPIMHPGELWIETGRWNVYGKELFRISDRHDRKFALGPTHEEVITDIVRKELRSYRDLPVNLYQIQTKFRDEVRPRFGVMRAREFMMKDSYSFHATEESLQETYMEMHKAYSRIFTRCGLDTIPVRADSGAIGGDVTQEFMVLADTGESEVFFCDCGYNATGDRAEAARPDEAAEEPKAIEEVDTPDQKTIEEVSAFLKVGPERLVKTLLYETEEGLVAALVPGDREINESKLGRALGGIAFEMATPETILEATGAPVGFSGPVGLKKHVRLIADWGVRAKANFVTGANVADKHMLNVNLKRDVNPSEFFDLVHTLPGEPCAECGKPLNSKRGIEVSQIFKLGTKYSTSMGATFLDKDGEAKPIIMGCYGLGVTRTVAAAIEAFHDENGIIWPMSIAPYQVLVLPINVSHSETFSTAEGIYNDLRAAGIEVLLDDRDERPGVKFKDADLIGIPLRITVGEKGLKDGVVELKERSSSEVKRVKLEEAAAAARAIVEDETKRLDALASAIMTP